MSRSNVVLPPPLGPHSATTSPAWPAASTWSSTRWLPKPAVTPVRDHATGPGCDGVSRAIGWWVGGVGGPVVTRPLSTVTSAAASGRRRSRRCSAITTARPYWAGQAARGRLDDVHSLHLDRSRDAAAVEMWDEAVEYAQQRRLAAA